jgi:DNA-binding transcriptional regulator YiaG
MTGKEIKQLRLTLNLTQVELAEMLNINVVTISRWEGGKFQPSPLAQKALSALRIRQDQAGLVRNSLT